MVRPIPGSGELCAIGMERFRRMRTVYCTCMIDVIMSFYVFFCFLFTTDTLKVTLVVTLLHSLVMQHLDPSGVGHEVCCYGF